MRLIPLCIVLGVVGLLAACGSAGGTDEAPQQPVVQATAEPTIAPPTAPPTPTPTPPPTATPDPGAALQDEQVVESAGYAFQPAEGWSVEVQEGIAALTAPDASIESGPTIVITVNAIDKLNIDEVSTADIETLDDFYAAMLASLDQETIAVTLEEPQDTTIDGLPTRSVAFRSTGFGDIEAEVAGHLAVAVVDAERAFVMLGIASPPDLWQESETFGAVLQSVRFLEPSAAAP